MINAKFQSTKRANSKGENGGNEKTINLQNIYQNLNLI